MTTPADAPPPESPADAVDPSLSTPAFVQPIVARPNRGFFIKRMAIALVVLALSGWLLYDGFVKYPRLNAEIDAIVAQVQAAPTEDEKAALRKRERDLGVRKADFDIFLQKVLGFALIPVGLYLLYKFARESRGELRLEGDVLHAPGHPPVPIDAITSVADARWDRKGIALFDYTLPDATSGRIRIDDFLFDRPPTDAIHDELIAKMPRT